MSIPLFSLARSSVFDFGLDTDIDIDIDTDKSNNRHVVQNRIHRLLVGQPREESRFFRALCRIEHCRWSRLDADVFAGVLFCAAEGGVPEVVYSAV